MKSIRRRLLSLLLALCMVIGAAPAVFALDLSEVKGHWAEESITAFADAGYLKGYEDGTIKPDQYITRAEFMTLINRVAGFTDTSTAISEYTDVSKSAWYYEDVSIALAAGYVIGISGTEMAPEMTITREMAITMIARAADMADEAAESELAALAKAFTDADDFSDWSIDSAASLYAAGALKGYKEGTTYTAKPQRNLSRAEAIEFLYRVMDLLQADDDVYVLMNIPYDAFYSAVGVADDDAADYDAIASATNKVGNYGKAGGSYHGAVATASIADDATVSAVGGENGAYSQGVIWPVKISVDDLALLTGTEITKDAVLTVATFAQNRTSYNTVVSYETLMEADSYSYFVLDEAPDYYMGLTVGSDGSLNFAVNYGTAVSTSADVTVSSDTNWGDVELSVGATDVDGKIINAVVITTSEGTKVGLVHLYNIWAYNDLAWYVENVAGLDGTTITNIRYYCSVKDADTTDGIAPDYVNYVYDYAVEAEVPEVYTGTVTAEFTSDSTIQVTGLPADATNVQAKVYYTSGGRNATYTYLTPLVVDESDDDIDPTTVDVVNGVITIEAGSVTNKAGTTQTYGTPVNGTTYTIELSCDDYIINKVTTVYDADALTLAAAISNLQAEIAEAEELLALYSESSDYYATLKAAIDAANAVLDNSGADVDTVQGVFEDLGQTMANAPETPISDTFTGSTTVKSDGSSKNFVDYNIIVTVTVEKDVVTNVTVDYSEANSSSVDYMVDAVKGYTYNDETYIGIPTQLTGKTVSEILSLGLKSDDSDEGIDAVSGATISSSAILVAVQNALKDAS